MHLTCTKCKRTFHSSLFSKDKSRRSGYRSACKVCSAAEFKKFRQSAAYTERLQRQIATRRHEKVTDPITRWAAVAVGNARRRAKAAGLEFSISKDWLVAQAPTRCVLLEVPLDYSATVSTAASASVDRRDSTKGYTPDNCRIISFKANRIKSNASVFEITLLARNLHTY
jgi:predicted nucleic acid-binding protein